MFCNATVTITRPATSVDSNGYATAGTTSTILTDAACLFSQQRNSRRVFADGIRQSVKVLYAVLIPDAGDAEPTIGDQAEVIHEGITRTYTVSDSVKTGGISESHWELTVEDLKTP